MAEKKKAGGWSDSMRALHDARHKAVAPEEGREGGQRTDGFGALGGDLDQQVIDKWRLGGDFDLNLHEKSRAYERKSIDLREGRYVAPAP
jgi:hypothetical protein